MGSPNLIKTPTVTKTTLAATTVTLVQATNIERTMVGLHNESGATIWFAFAESAPANTDTMEPLPDATGIYFEANTGLSRANLYAYSTAGGVVKTSEAL
jgi:hypothetical protein